VKTLVHIGAFDKLVPNRRWLESTLDHQELVSSVAGCAFTAPSREIVWLPTPLKGEPPEPETLEWQLPCSYDWMTDPDVLGRSGKPKKRRPPPKKCTRACRSFTQVEPPTPKEIAPYTPEEIRDIETELIGAYLSSTPFDRIPAEDKERLATAVDLLTGNEGKYMLAVVVKAVRTKNDRNGKEMAFLTLGTERGEFECTVFSSVWVKCHKEVRAGALAYVSVYKNDRGQTLDVFMSLED
jgi:DNA polymerase-3 subunit alpha